MTDTNTWQPSVGVLLTTLLLCREEVMHSCVQQRGQRSAPTPPATAKQKQKVNMPSTAARDIKDSVKMAATDSATAPKNARIAWPNV